jgi:hypothetical protein
MSETSFDSKRRLCPDGSCIGVIGSDGRCGECGRSASGAGPGKAFASVAGEPAANAPAVSQANADAYDADADAYANDAAAEPSASTAAAAGEGGFDPSRRLCDDGTCVGVIGPDGRCGVCGREA